MLTETKFDSDWCPTSYSVVIRTRNSDATLATTLKALFQQSHRPTEVIVVDNGSKDRTIEIASSFGSKVKIVRYPDDVPFHYSKALNLGLEHATCPFVLIISSHIKLVLIDTMEKSSCFLETNPTCAGVFFGGVPMTDIANKTNHKIQTGDNFHANNRAQVIRRSLWFQTPFSEEVPTCEDHLWSRTLKKRGWSFAFMPKAIQYDNPYMNLSKRYQEAYTMSRYIETTRERNKKILTAVKLSLLRLVCGDFGAAWQELCVAWARIEGVLGFERNFISSSYRND